MRGLFLTLFGAWGLQWAMAEAVGVELDFLPVLIGAAALRLITYHFEPKEDET